MDKISPFELFDTVEKNHSLKEKRRLGSLFRGTPKTVTTFEPSENAKSFPASPSSDTTQIESDNEFPTPTVLLGKDSSCFDDIEDTSRVSESSNGTFHTLVMDQRNYLNLRENVYDINASDGSLSNGLTGSKKRSPDPNYDQPEAKFCRVQGNQVTTPTEVPKALPEWINEIDPNLIAFFEGFVDFQ